MMLNSENFLIIQILLKFFDQSIFRLIILQHLYRLLLLLVFLIVLHELVKFFVRVVFESERSLASIAISPLVGWFLLLWAVRSRVCPTPTMLTKD
jgi:hypothetical protein